MQPRKAIIDTSVLISLYHLDLLRFLKLIYFQVKVPAKVEEEFFRKPTREYEKSLRFKFLTEFYNQNGSWFTKCNEYGSDLIQLFLTENIDEGEAEVFAQNQSLGSIYELLLDEKEGRKIAKSKFIKHHGVLYILANFHIRYGCCDYLKSVQKLKKETRDRFDSNIIAKVYEEVKKEI